jgi:long-subunit fatty acid transport protein
VFNGFGDPYTLLNAFAFLANIQLSEDFSLRGRLQYETSESALNVSRSYYAISAGATYKFNPHWILDGGVMYRGGKTENVGEVKFNDIILNVGLAFSW